MKDEIIINPDGQGYNGEDFKTLQEQSLLIEKAFQGRGAFLMSGCEIDSTNANNSSIGAGVIFLDGQVLEFEGANGVDLSAENEAYIFALESKTERLRERKGKSSVYTREVTNTKIDLAKPTDREFITITKNGVSNRMIVTEFPKPKHEWKGKKLRFENSDGSWGNLVNLKGDKGDKGEIGDKPTHEWQGTQLRFQNQDGSWGNLVNLKGDKGDKGEAGDKPTHEWQGTQLRFQNQDGSWGNLVNLKGDKGDKGSDSNLSFVKVQRGFIEPTSSHDFLEFRFNDGAINRSVYLVGSLTFG